MQGVYYVRNNLYSREKMSGSTKKRLCWNCEARVSLEEENCTYCGVYLSPASFPGLQHEESIPEPLYKPEAESVIPKSPYGALYEEQIDGKDSEPSLKSTPRSEDLRSIAIPFSLLLGGTIFFLFGIILFLFSSHEVFTLQWNASYWYFYLLIAVPLLYFGWQKCQNSNCDSKIN